MNRQKYWEVLVISEDIFKETTSPIEQTLSNSLEELVNLFKKGKTLSNDEAKSISLLIQDRYLKKALITYIGLKKHVRGKYIEQIMKMFKNTAEIVASSNKSESFFSNMGQRLRGG